MTPLENCLVVNKRPHTRPTFQWVEPESCATRIVFPANEIEHKDPNPPINIFVGLIWESREGEAEHAEDCLYKVALHGAIQSPGANLRSELSLSHHQWPEGRLSRSRRPKAQRWKTTSSKLSPSARWKTTSWAVAGIWSGKWNKRQKRQMFYASGRAAKSRFQWREAGAVFFYFFSLTAVRNHSNLTKKFIFQMFSAPV